MEHNCRNALTNGMQPGGAMSGGVTIPIAMPHVCSAVIMHFSSSSARVCNDSTALLFLFGACLIFNCFEESNKNPSHHDVLIASENGTLKTYLSTWAAGTAFFFRIVCLLHKREASKVARCFVPLFFQDSSRRRVPVVTF